MIPVLGIPVLNRGDLLERLINCIDFPVQKLVIINNGNDSGVADALYRINSSLTEHAYIHELEIIKPQRNLGVAASWNMLIGQNQDAPYVMICANDMLVLEGEWKRFYEFIEERHTSHAVLYGYAYNFFAVTKLGWQTIGTFDENFFPAYCEDVDHFYRIKVSGAVTAGLPDAQIKHGEAPNWGSETVFSDKSLMTANKRTHANNKHYYSKKWGGAGGEETFKVPFGNSRNTIGFWQYDADFRNRQLMIIEESKQKPQPVVAQDRRKRILWVSEYNWNTGFSRVSENLIKHLKHEFDITVLDIYRNIQKPQREDGIEIIGKLTDADTSCTERIKSIYWLFDAIFILNDVWNIYAMLNELQAVEGLPRIVIYFPVDAREHNPKWYSLFDMVSVPVTYTEFAKGVVLEAISFLPVELKSKIEQSLTIIPHGIDHSTYFEIPDKKELRRQFFRSDMFTDDFIFLNANRNQPRKRLDITMRAFTMLLKQYQGDRQLRLLMHSGNTDCSIDIGELATRYGIGKHVIRTSEGRGRPQVSEKGLNMIYNVCDAGLNTSIGEGWGLTNVEHAVTGAVQLVPRHSACIELFQDCGLLVDCEFEIMMDEIMTMGAVPSVTSMCKAMQIVVNDKELANYLKNKSLNKFSHPMYSWENLSNIWMRIL